MKNKALDIIENCQKELWFLTARSGGSGGQHVNKVETKVILRWNISESEYLNEESKQLLLKKLFNFINNDGILSINDESSRSQIKNKKNVQKKWESLIEEALIVKKPRKKSKPSKAAIEKRIKEKKAKAELKANRKKPRITD